MTKPQDYDIILESGVVAQLARASACRAEGREFESRQPRPCQLSCLKEVNQQKVDLKGILKRLKLSEQNISMILGALVIIVIGALIFNYFRGVGKREEAPETQPTPGEIQLIEEEGRLVPEGLPKTHQVQVGEHLWSIAEKYFGSGYNWVDIARENNLANPNRILVGQELVIPKSEVIEPVELPATGVKPSITGDKHTVQKSDSLWDIAVRAYGDGYQWTKIWHANENLVKNPDLIYPDQVLSLPQ